MISLKSAAWGRGGSFFQYMGGDENKQLFHLLSLFHTFKEPAQTRDILQSRHTVFAITAFFLIQSPDNRGLSIKKSDRGFGVFGDNGLDYRLQHR